MDLNQIYYLGDCTITRVPELILNTNTPGYLFPQWNRAVIDEHKKWLLPANMDETCTHLIQSIHTWVLRFRQHTILIDTATGNDKERWIPSLNRLRTPYMERLREAGVTPDMVDYVILTHIHVDHVGWNTHLADERWVPTFPNATYVFSKAEHKFWSNLENYTENTRIKYQLYLDSVLPIFEADQAMLVEPNGDEFLEGVSFCPVPGHTIGQMAVLIRSKGEEALFGGDIMHHPIQVYYPDWNSVYCEDAETARASRRWALDFLADHHALYFSSHFAETSAGYVTRNNGQYQWSFFGR